MVKSYKDYCREALEKFPEVYKYMFNPDGSRKASPIMKSIYKKKALHDVPEEELETMEKDGWTPEPPKPPEPKRSDLEITGTEIKIKGRKINLTILELPKKSERKEYNRVWMNNARVRQRIKKLKEQYGTSIIIQYLSRL